MGAGHRIRAIALAAAWMVALAACSIGSGFQLAPSEAVILRL